MDEASAERVVELLRERSVFASVSRRTGVYRTAVRVVIPDGREALWDADGAAGLEAMVLRNGVLVGYVETIPGSEHLDEEQTAALIAAHDYDAPPPPRAARPRAETASGPRPPAAPPRATAPGLLGRLRRRKG